MKESTQNGLLVGFSLWLLTMLLGIPLGFLQLGYNPRYLLQLIFATHCWCVAAENLSAAAGSACLPWRDW